MSTLITERPPGTRAKVFPAATKVAFRDHEGKVREGVLVRTFTPGPRAGRHYEIRVGGYNAVIFAQGPVGRTVTRQQ